VSVQCQHSVSTVSAQCQCSVSTVHVYVRVPLPAPRPPVDTPRAVPSPASLCSRPLSTQPDKQARPYRHLVIPAPVPGGAAHKLTLGAWTCFLGCEVCICVSFCVCVSVWCLCADLSNDINVSPKQHIVVKSAPLSAVVSFLLLVSFCVVMMTNDGDSGW
jgi:hypothetical protein